MILIRTSFILVLLNFVLAYSINITKQVDAVHRERNSDLISVKPNITKISDNKNFLRTEKNQNSEKFTMPKKFFLFIFDEHYEKFFLHFLIFFQLLNIILFMWFFLQCLLSKHNLSLITRI